LVEKEERMLPALTAVALAVEMLYRPAAVAARQTFELAQVH
jgi:hypothetical protein